MQLGAVTENTLSVVPFYCD